MPSINVDVDVELADFDLDDIIEYVIDEIKLKWNKEKLRALKNSLNSDISDISIQSLDDQIKYEHITKVFHKYSTDYFEKQLPV